MEYSISTTELERRKKAFTSLTISLMTGTIIFAAIFQLPIPIIGYLLLAAILFLSRVLVFKSFRYLSQVKISLSNQSIIRSHQQITEKYLLSEIKAIKIKKTTRGSIREIYVWLDQGKSIFFTALTNFTPFKVSLLKRVKKNVTSKEIHELIDFDHPLFYPILGLLISSFGIATIKLIINLSEQNIKIVLKFFAVYTLSVGTYIVCAQPISKRYGNKAKFADYILGLSIICAGIVIGQV